MCKQYKMEYILLLQAVVISPQVDNYACCLALLDIAYNLKMKDQCFNRF